MNLIDLPNAALSRMRVVLVKTSHPGNIGAAARAMKTMGISNLVLVAPEVFPSALATARAAGAADVLERARVVQTLPEALVGVQMAGALTARRRELALPFHTPRQASERLGQVALEGEVALVFGNETSGLSNEDLAYCHMPITIPTQPGYSSLNLGSAVQVMCYEMRMAALALSQAEDSVPQPSRVDRLASHDEVEGFFAHLERALTESGFYDPQHSRRLFPRVRRLFGRVALEHDEVSILRGMLTSFQAKWRQ